ncbi:hypothetical protein Pfo_010902 [Paulownia fortunei]|nr:hypothetical protein Pfo_010902 [Paulownia fortunei]
MEVEEEKDDDLGELCAEILENWTSPIYSDLAHSSFHQNPFSLHHHQLSTAYDIQRVQEEVDIYGPQLSLHASQPHQSLSCTNVEMKISTSKPKYEDSTEDFESEHKEDKRMKALKTTYEKGSKHEQAEKSNASVCMDQPIIPVLVADTFFDTLLGHVVDGIDIAALNKVKEAKACDEAGDNLRIIFNKNDAGASTVSTKNEKELEKLNSGQISSGFKQAQVQVRSSGQSKISAVESRQLQKEGAMGEVKLDRGIDERLPFVDSKDLSFYDSDVIIEIVMRESFYENELRREYIKEDDVLIDAEGAKPLSDSGNTQHINCRMINGDKFLPFPMDSYSAEDRDNRQRKKEQSQKNDDAHLIKPSRKRKTDFSENNYIVRTNTHERIGAVNTHSKTLDYRKIKQGYQSSSGKEMVKLMGSHEMVKHHSSRSQREHFLSHVGQRNQKRVMFNLGHQTNHHKLDINLAESLCSPRVEAVKEKMENYASERVQKESARGIIPTKSHNSEIKMEVEGLVGINIEEDPEKLKRRSERFKLPLPFLKNVVVDKSMESETNRLLLQDTATMDSDIKDQRSTRRRKWTSS